MAASSALQNVGLSFMALCIAGYILAPPLYWHFMEGLATIRRSSSSSNCHPCFCDCSSQPAVSIAEGLENTTFRDCVKRDPGMNKDTEKTFTEMLSEELKLKEAEVLESHRRADISLLEAKRMTSQYQKEADKCNSGMETCEEAREMAEAALVAQRRLTILWQSRAHRRGWRVGIAKSHAQSRDSVETA